jgi:hypothetical protein
MRHLINAVRGPHNPEDLLVVPLSAYFDESWTDGTVLVVSGFLSSEQLWLKFEKKWNKLLADSGLKFFRMVDFAQSKGEFKDWKGKEDKRKKFLEKAIEIIAKHTWASFAAGVILKDWDEGNRLFKLKEQKLRPYSLCGWACVDHIYKWCAAQTRPYPWNQVLLIFEDGAPKQGDLDDRVKLDFNTKIQFVEKIPKNGNTPLGALQAADFSAWHLRNVFLKYEAGELQEFRRDFEALFSRVQFRGNHAYFSMSLPTNKSSLMRITDESNSGEVSLTRFCKDYGIPRRNNKQ